MNYIKTNHKWARQRGTTLIELSVVIAVILLLVGVLFIGVTAWRDGANKAACLVNISSIQKAVRGYQNLNNLNVGDTLASTSLTATTGGIPGFFSTMPTCPIAATAYTTTGTVPAVGTPYATCATTTNGGPHTPASTANW
jgi:prepilin-type N-terminal cleavage/methylation domain-containing protein